jgi:mannose-1-phosphate guanylyltransferase/mannose-6-phosphate isomerase
MGQAEARKEKNLTIIYPVIMCGGSGTRLWPVSRKSIPKQYQAIVSDKSMLSETIARFPQSGSLKVAPPSFVCGIDHETHVRHACAEDGIDPHLIILEPCARNTAAVAAAISLTIGDESDALILLLPADHHIEDAEGFRSVIKAGMSAALNGALITFGIKPTGPETGYGYIKSGQNLGPKIYQVDAFVEKPDRATAEQYLAAGDFSWNAGIFLFAPSKMRESFETLAPEILSAVETAVEQGCKTGAALFLDPESFSKCPSDSIDYAIMEKSDNVQIVSPVDIGWSDIGSWDALRDMAIANEALEQGASEIISLDSVGTLIKSTGPAVAAIGVSDLIIVATETSVLVSKAGQTQKVKNIVDELKRRDGADII